MQEIYLDNSASTPLHPEVLQLMNRLQKQLYGNPSAMHERGVAAGRAIAGARRDIATVLGVSESEIIFTSGGTEANNLAICGAARRNRNRGNHLVTTVFEHPSALSTFRFLEQEGFKVTYLPVDKSGLPDLELLKHEVNPATTLISIMHVNNEIGAVLPLAAIGQVIKARNPQALFHVDAVQSFTKLTLDPIGWQCDLISLSGHKIHGPKGAGCLWLKKGALLEPLFHGGGQEMGLRSGTENTAAIAGFGLAAQLSESGRNNKAAALQDLKRALITELENHGLVFSVNGPDPEAAAPHIINLAFPGLKAEMLLHSLEDKNIYVSAGSACHSRHPEPSHVLKAIGLDNDLLESSLRFSFSSFNSLEEVILAAQVTAETVRHLMTLLEPKVRKVRRKDRS